MKLYTEDQVIQMTQAAFTAGQNHNTFIFGEVYKNITPIEIPSDDDIYQAEPKECSGDFDLGVMNGFRKGAKWMRDKIQGGKK